MTTQAIVVPLNPLAPLGLNKQSQGSVLSPGWARKAVNLVYGNTGELEVREGSQIYHTTAFSTLANNTTVRSLYNYVDGGGVSRLVGAINTKAGLAGTPTGTLLIELTSGVVSDKSGSTGWTSVYSIPQFTTFNDKCIGLCAGEDLVSKTTSGNFADISKTGSYQPSTAASALLSAFGRLWVLDGDSLKYSDLLDETAWNSVYDLGAYWGSGDDTGVALAEFNGHLIVFGKSNIIIYNADQGPDDLVKVEVISGVGCLARDTVQRVGDDIWFLSQSGLISLGRTIVQKSMPIDRVSKNVNDFLLDSIYNLVSVPSNFVNLGIIYATYCPLKNLYVLTVSSEGVGSSTIFAFDTKIRFEDGAYRATTWTGVYTACCTEKQTGNLILGGTTSAASIYTARICYYGGYGGDYRTYASNNGGTAITFQFNSPWMDLGFLDSGFSNKTKILKSMSALVYVGDDVTETGTPELNLGWDVDFNVSDSSVVWDNEITFTPTDDDTYRLYKTPITGNGKFISFTIYGTGILNLVRLNSLNIQLKIGKDVV